jgi:hypothetical protein
MCGDSKWRGEGSQSEGGSPAEKREALTQRTQSSDTEITETKAKFKTGGKNKSSETRPWQGVDDAAGSDVEESLIEVGDDVLDVFDANRQPHQTFGDAHSFANLLRHGGVGHQRWQRDQRFDAAETLGE